MLNDQKKRGRVTPGGSKKIHGKPARGWSGAQECRFGPHHVSTWQPSEAPPTFVAACL